MTRPKSKIQKKSSKANVPIVGVGASAGGMEALKLFLKRLPKKVDFCLVIIQHLDPKHQSDLAEILSRSCLLPVTEIKKTSVPKMGHVYIIPPNHNLTLKNGNFKLTPRSSLQKFNLPVDIFFQSLAEDKKNQAIGVVLSGTGSDGTQGLIAIKAEGGITFAQDPKSAKFDGMPRNAILSGAVDFTLSPELIINELVRITQDTDLNSTDYPLIEKKGSGTHDNLKKQILDRIFTIIQKTTDVNFSGYKQSTILRRLSRRLLLLKIKDLKSYADYLETNPEEVRLLFSDILIHVTKFFRDSKSYQFLKNKIIPQYIKNRGHTKSFRVWVAGCSTGEEAYSIAMILFEYFDENELDISLQIFATDISEHAIKKARTGYFTNIEADISKDRLEKFFEKTDHGYRVSKRLREACLFSKHDVTSDPPFAKIDMVSCRNLLIYFSSELQKKIIPIFHYSLNPSGILWLGSSESVSEHTSLFSEADKKNRIFLKKNISVPYKFKFSVQNELNKDTRLIYKRDLELKNKFSLQNEVERVALMEYAPAHVVINDAFDILQVKGHTAPFLELPQGITSLKLTKMVQPEIVPALRATTREAQEKNHSAVRNGLKFIKNGVTVYLNLRVVPLKLPAGSKEQCFTVFFEKFDAPQSKMLIESVKKGKSKTKSAKSSRSARQSKKTAKDKDHLIDDLQKQLTEGYEYQQSLIEEYETSQEDLTASNEELQSANEELQSTNEELETAKEELQSTNEELTTVNDELSTRNAEMKILTSDLLNLFSNVDIPMIMVDQKINIRRFTSAAGKVLGLKDSDIAKNISAVIPNFGNINLENLINDIIQNQTTKESEVLSHDNIWYRLITRPYRTAEDNISGAVLVWIDINKLKKSIDSLSAAYTDAASIIETMPMPLLVISQDKKIKFANEAFYNKFKVKSSETINFDITKIGNGQWDLPEFIGLLEKVLFSNIRIEGFEIEHNFPNIGMKSMRLFATKSNLAGSGTPAALLAIEDVSELKKNERNLQHSEQKYFDLLMSSYDGILVVRPDKTIEFSNPMIEKMFGYSSSELLNLKFEMLIPSLDLHKYTKLTSDPLNSPTQKVQNVILETDGLRKDGSKFPANVSLNPFISNSDVFINCTIRDVTEQKMLNQVQADLQTKEKALLFESEKSNRVKDEFLAVLSHELRTPLTAILGWSQELLNKTADKNAIEKGLAIIERSAQAQEQLINDLLDISRIRAEKIHLNLEKVDVSETLNQSIESVRKLSDKKNIQLTADLTSSPCVVLADSNRLKQVFLNLLINSIKFTPSNGKIIVSMVIQENTSGKTAQIKISDTGLGIKPEFLPQLFQKFSQVDSSSARNYGGLGLGLAISKSLIDLHKGTITAESPGEGKGAVFTINLPLATAHKNMAQIKSIESSNSLKLNALKGLKILAVDDNEDNRDLFSVVLKSLGADVRMSESVAEAVNVYKEFQPEMILTDISMPKEDGYVMLNKIRKLEESSGKKIPIIAVTAHASLEDKKQMLDAGFTDYVAKPIDRKVLIAVLLRHTPKSVSIS